jgi:hypothetical protein
MRNIKVFVEGQTERLFTNEILKPYFYERNFSIIPVLFQEGGGIPKYSKARKEIIKAIKSDRSCFCTTMVDFYGMPSDWPGRVESKSFKDYKDKAYKIEQALLNDIIGQMGDSWNPAQFIPYVQMHEFEALLFSNVSVLAENNPSVSDSFANIVKSFSCPEEINDNYETCPSPRIKQHIANYDKRVDGIIKAQNIGLKTMRRECPHFNEWITRLESLGER